MQAPTPELEAEARAFVCRYATAYGLDPDKVWREHYRKLLQKGLDWFVNQRKKEEAYAADYRASQTAGRNSLSAIQWPTVETAPAPAPAYISFADFLERTTFAMRIARCRAAAKKAGRPRVLSPPPRHRLSGHDVWNVIEASRGRCVYCGSLAVENRPSKPNGAPAAWAQVGRRIGTLEHQYWRAAGGDNDLSNLAWCCLWCNTWESERRQGATDHGGFYPQDDGPAKKGKEKGSPSQGPQLKQRAHRQRHPHKSPVNQHQRGTPGQKMGQRSEISQKAANRMGGFFAHRNISSIWARRAAPAGRSSGIGS